MIHDFNRSLEVGDAGEQVIIDWLKSGKNTLAVVDLRKQPNCQALDVDFAMVSLNGVQFKLHTLELKTDNTEYDNLFYEEVSANETNSKGCLAKTKANTIIYLYIKLGFAYIFDTQAFRQWVASKRNILIGMGKLKHLKNYRYNGYDTYTTTGLAIPRTMIDQDLASFGTKIQCKRGQ